MIADMTEAEVVIPENIPDQIGGSPIVKLDLSRIEKEFGKIDYTNLGVGLQKTIDYQRKLYAT
jgi:hypothetical protein